MRRLLPEPSDTVDLYEAYRPPVQPWLRANMVVSADGAAAGVGGRTEDLGGEGDQEVFRILRAHADAILVGAGTVRTEGYGPHRLRPDLAARRRRDGRPQPAAVVVVSRSLDLDLRSSLFTAAVTPTVVITCAAAPPEARAGVGAAATVLECGDDEVDLRAAVFALHELGMRSVLCEGGPQLLAHAVAGGVVDELCLTLAATLVGRPAPRLLDGLASPVDLTLGALLEHSGELYLRYELGAE